MTILVRSVFEEDGKFYPQIHLDERLYELQFHLKLDKFYCIGVMNKVKKIFLLTQKINV